MLRLHRRRSRATEEIQRRRTRAPHGRGALFVCSRPIANRSPNAPLFENPDGKPLSYNFFINTIRVALESAGLNPKAYAGHSFCHGAASEAAAAGYSNYEIQLLGRWRSDAYKLYIETSLNRILHLSSLLHMAHPHSIPFEPPALRDYTALA